MLENADDRFRFGKVQFVLILATSLKMAPAIPVTDEREYCIGLAHVCAHPNSEPEEGVPVVMLHGLTGTKETWEGIYQNIALLTRRRVCIYDARNHGDSEWSDTFSVDTLADDLGNFMKSMNIETAALVGHSLGGLTAMKFALKNPSKVERLFVEDISPFSISRETVESLSSFVKLLVSSLSAIPKDADEDTAQKAVTEFIYQATNKPPPEHLFNKFPFRRRDGVWQWKSNFDAFIRGFNDTNTFIGTMEGQYDGKVFFIYGKASFFNVADDIKDIRKMFPKAEFFGVEDASHVIHSEHPEFLTELVKFLKSADLQDIPSDEILTVTSSL